jgi:AraC-like DNA-binding protein
VGELGAVRLSELQMAWQRPPSQPCQAARTPTLIRQADSDPEQYRVDLLIRGRLRVEQAGRQATLNPGDFTLVDWSRPARWAAAIQQAVALTFPRALLPLPHTEVARLAGVPISGDHGTAALFSSLAREAIGRLDNYGPADATRVGTILVDLLATALAARLERNDQLPPDSQQQALLRSIHAFVEQRLADPSLSPAMIAAAHHISLRYLYKVFECEQRGVAARIRERRLERCRRDLLDPALATRPVSTIAARWGLTDPARFSRVFRNAYGLAPLEYRRTMGGVPVPHSACPFRSPRCRSGGTRGGGSP